MLWNEYFLKKRCLRTHGVATVHGVFQFKGHRLQDLKIFSSFISGRPSESHDKVQCAKRDYEFREFVNLSCVTTAR